jgi:cytochrome o ubiquinol oxidase subunit 2
MKHAMHRAGITLFAAMMSPVVECHAGVLDPVGPVGSGDRTILLDSLAIMLCVVVPVIIATLFFAWWFRASHTRAKYLPDWEYSGRIELVVWSIPAMIVLFLGGVAWVGSHQLDPHHPLKSAQKPLQVEVVSMDWKWLFIYPDQGVASVNRLVIPVGVPVEFSLTSADVMNSFFVPRLGSQIYTMAGMVTHINLEAEQRGVFPGFSAQFSGDGFSEMRFDTLAVPPDEFAQWAGQARASPDTLDQATYETLLKPSTSNPVATYRGVTPEFFKRILEESAPGTMTGAMQDPAEIPASSPPAGEKD